MKKITRILSMVLAVLFVFGLLPIGELSLITAAEADSKVTAKEATDIMTAIWNQSKGAGNKYWNGFFAGTNVSNNKQLEDAANSKQYSKAFTNHKHAYSSAKKDKGHQYDHGFCNSNYYRGCQQCRGFAKWVTYCIFGKSFFNGSFNKSWKKIYPGSVNDYVFKPGDYICLKGSKAGSHYVVVWEVYNAGKTDEKIKIIECNLDGFCGIGSRTLSRSSLVNLIQYKEKPTDSMKGWVASSPAILCGHTRIDAVGDCIDCGNYHVHKYRPDGVCLKPGCTGKDSLGNDADYYSAANIEKITEPMGAYAMPGLGVLFYVYKLPKKDSGFVDCVANNLTEEPRKEPFPVQKAWIKGKIKNTVDGTDWYVVTDFGYWDENNKPVVAYVPTNIVVTTNEPRFVISNATSPKHMDIAKQDKDVLGKVDGKIYAYNTKIKTVAAAIFALDGENSLTEAEDEDLRLLGELSADQLNTLAGQKAVITDNHKNRAFKTNLNADSFNLHDFYDDIWFSHLVGGRMYCYCVSVTDANGHTESIYRAFYLRKNANELKSYSVEFSGISKNTYASGTTVTFPNAYEAGSRFLGWAENANAETASFARGESYVVTRDVVFYPIFSEIDPPAAPVMVATEHEICLGDTQSISWNQVAGANRYVAHVYDESGEEVGTYTAAGAASMMLIPFAEAGVYTIRVSAENDGLYASEESAQATTVTVHAPSVVTYYDYDGSVLLTQSGVRYGEDAPKPQDPVRIGYAFEGWATENGAEPDGDALKNIVEDRSLYAVYAEKYYTVTFYDRDGNAQYVSVRHGEKAIAPNIASTVVDGGDTYTFIGWDNRDWDADEGVTKEGIVAHPVYILSAADLPLTIEIDETQTRFEEDDNGQVIGYWVYYTIKNRLGVAKMGRVILAAKTNFGKLITQTESGAFYIRGQVGASYTGNAYIPLEVEGSDMLSIVDAYVVESYHSTKPIALATTLEVRTNTESIWMTEEEFAALSSNDYESYTTHTQYQNRLRLSKTVREGDSADLTGWNLVSSETIEGEWSDWSEWQDAAVAATASRQVEMQEIQTGTQTQYRYGRWYASSAIGAQSGKTFSPAASPALAHAKYNYKNAASIFSKNYTSWGTKKITPVSDTFHTSYHDSDKTYFKVSSGQYYWHIYYNGSQTTANKYFWEETQTVPITKTQYRYRDKAPDETYNTYEKWTDWSTWSFDIVTPSEDQEVQTRVLYNVKMKTIAGNAIPYSGTIPSAAGKQALLTVYKVDEASDYSNQYIKQVEIGSDGSYAFDVYTLQQPTWASGEYKVALMIEGASEPIQLAPIPVPENEIPEYTVTFKDGISGQNLGLQRVKYGESVQAPDENMEDLHPGYYFLGWDYGFGNIRENMTITARYVEKKYTVVFVDPVNYSITMKTDLPVGTELTFPSVEAVDGYTFLGWKTPDGREVSTVEGHMIIVADYEHITYTVTFMSNNTVLTGETTVVVTIDENGNETTEEVPEEITVPLTSMQINKHAYIPDIFDNVTEELFLDDEEDLDDISGTNAILGKRFAYNVKPLTAAGADEDEVQEFSESDLGIPEGMYFVGWSGGVNEPVTDNIILTPVFSYYEETREIEPSLDGGIYLGVQTVQLFDEIEDVEGIDIQYRILTNNNADSDWVDYDPYNSPDIDIDESCVLEIVANEDNKNGYSASFEYIIVTNDELPATPNNLTATQTDADSISVSWQAVEGADGYVVFRTTDSGEESQFLAEGTSFVDRGVSSLRKYTYRVNAYVIREKFGASVLLESNDAPAETVMFFGENQPVTAIEIVSPESVYKGSTAQLSAIVSPSEAYDSTVMWTVTNGTGEGSVSTEGLFYGIEPGTVTVIAKSLDGSDTISSRTILVKEIETGVGTAALTVSSTEARAGGKAVVRVSISEESLLNYMQFTVLYDSEKLELISAEEGELIKNEAPNIGTTEAGEVLFTWDSNASLVEGGTILELTFKAKKDASGDSIISIPTGGTYRYIFGNDNQGDASVAEQNGVLTIIQMLLGDVNESGGVNIIDASLIRRYTVKLASLTETQLLAADVNGDGSVDVRDAHMIRRYIAHLLDAFPAA